MSKKFACVTWYKDNYGSILQAYALQRAAESVADIRVEQLRYSDDAYSKKNRLSKLLKLSPLYIAKRAYSQLAYRAIAERQRTCAEFVSGNINVSDKVYSVADIGECNRDYDGFICGSDQIWNGNIRPVTDLFVLEFAEEGKKRIAYAPSAGDSIPEHEKELFAKELPGFTALSCREQKGTDGINRILGEERCVTVADPTILADNSVWDSLSQTRPIKEKYIFCYFLRLGKEERKCVERFAERRGLKIANIPFADARHAEKYDKKFGDYRIAASPDGFVSLIRHAEYVFTDSFHCCVFSMLYHTPFLVFRKAGTKGENERIKNLLEDSGIPFEYLEPDTPDKEIMKKFFSIDWEQSDKVLSKKREKAQAFLKDAAER